MIERAAAIDLSALANLDRLLEVLFLVLGHPAQSVST